MDGALVALPGLTYTINGGLMESGHIQEATA
jgi:hypothetical protein